METKDRIAALAQHLDEDPETMAEGRASEIDAGRRSYLVLTDEEADERAREEIENSLWAFQTTFLRAHSKILGSMNEAGIKAWDQARETMCEEANDLVRALIDDLDHLVADAIACDGRGHFVSGYDGEENEATYQGRTVYIYRVN